MPRINWDEPGDRQFRTGLDRGVLYPQSGNGVPWNGLVSLTENDNREVKSYYIDGVKYLDHEVPGDWSGKLQAFTYPEILDEILGTYTQTPGVRVHDQPTKTFHLSYRTKIGNDLEGEDFGYIVHILYNLRAIPDEVTHTTRGAEVTPELFSWSLTATPPAISGIRPTAHISVDSRDVSSENLGVLENYLYGGDAQSPTVFDLVSLLTMLALDGE